MTSPPPLPATGAWLAGDEPGHRQFFTFATDRRFALDCGTMLSDVVVAYETWGRLDADAANAVLVCHAWTGDSHAAGRPGGATRRRDGGTTRSGRASRSTPTSTLSCARTCSAAARASTGPASPHPVDGRPYGSRFPVVTIRDMVRAQRGSPTTSESRRWLSVIGGSMGGMQAIEWAVMYPASRALDSCRSPPACRPRRSRSRGVRSGGAPFASTPPGAVATTTTRRPATGPHEGLEVARMVAQVTFRSDNVFTDRFGRELADTAKVGDTLDMWQRFEVERYLEYHGTKLGPPVRHQQLPR